MDIIERVRELIKLMSSNELAEIEVEQPELKIRIKKIVQSPVYSFPQQPYQVPQGPLQNQFALPTQAAQSQATGLAPVGAAAETAVDDSLATITSPMVGTFYRASSPEAEPYVEEGAIVDNDTVVSIIEAMKVMNEIKAEVNGEIVEVCVEDAEPVEFGQVLFRVRPLSQ